MQHVTCVYIYMQYMNVILLTFTHAQGYGTHCVCQFVSQSVCFPAMVASNSHNLETSSITTKRGIGMGTVAFFDVILLKCLSMKCEA